MKPWFNALCALIYIVSFSFVVATPMNAVVNEVPEIFAEAAVVIDADTGAILFEKNKARKEYPASITKVMTTVLALEKFNAEDTIVYSESAIHDIKSGSSSIGIRVGEELTFDQALHGMLLMSANEVTNGIAENHSGTTTAFVEAMNTKVETMGLTGTHFSNPHGLHDANHYTTAYDMALISKELLDNSYFMEVMGHTMYQIPVTNKCDEIRYLAQQHKMLNNKNDMTIYREDVIAGKVGFTSESGYSLMTVADNGEKRVIVVVFNSDWEHIYDDTAALIDYSYEAVGYIPESIDVNQTEDELLTEENAEETIDGSFGVVQETDESTGSQETETDEGVLANQSTTEDNPGGGLLSTFFKIIIWVVVLGAIAYGGLYLYAKEKRRKKKIALLRERYKKSGHGSI